MKKATKSKRIFSSFITLSIFLSIFLTLPAPLLYSHAAAPVFPGAGIDSPFYLYVEKGAYSITVFCKDEYGNYSIPLRTFPTAIGRSSRMTPTGIFQKGERELWHSWGSTYSPYTSEYTKSLYIHGPIYGNTNFDSLISSSASQIGSAVSSGCLRTTAEAAYFFYEYCPVGTIVHIVDGAPYGYYAPAPIATAQYADPAGMTLGEIFPDFANSIGDIYDYILNGSKYIEKFNEPWGKDAHYAWQKRDANPNMRIEINKYSLELAYTGDLGSVEKLNAHIVFGENFVGFTPQIESSAIYWMSSDNDVVTVGADGSVYLVGPGRAYIIALGPDGMASDVCPVTVSYQQVRRDAAGDALGSKDAQGTQDSQGSQDSQGPQGPQSSQGAGGSPAAGPMHSESVQFKEGLRNIAEDAFPDLAEGHWVNEAAGRLKQLGIIEGTGKKFGPDDDITNVEYLKMLVLATLKIRGGSLGDAVASREATDLVDISAAGDIVAAGDVVTARNILAAANNANAAAGDGVAAGDGANAASNGVAKGDEAWYVPYIRAALILRIIDSSEANELRMSPEAFISRENFCLWTGRAFKYRLSSPDAYPDYDEFINTMMPKRLVSELYINIFVDGKFHPGAFVTRAVAAQTLSNLLKSI